MLYCIRTYYFSQKDFRFWLSFGQCIYMLYHCHWWKTNGKTIL